MTEVRRILVPVDFSSGSREAVRCACAWGARLGATVELLHVWQIPPFDTTLTVMRLTEEGRAHVEQRGREYAQAELTELLGSLEGAPGDRPVHAYVEVGDPVEKILEAAESRAYDLIVMGTHGRTGLAHMLLGSVTEQVLARAPCPVLAVPLRDVSRGRP